MDHYSNDGVDHFSVIVDNWCIEHFQGIPQQVWYDNMKTVVIERDAYGEGNYRFNQHFY